MEAWWVSLTAPLQVFYAIAIGTSLLLLLQLLLMVVGFDADAHGDFDADADATGGGHVLSVRTVTAFFVGFGWTGVAALERGYGVTVSILLAVAVGGVFMLGVLVLMRSLYGLRYSGTLDYRNAIGVVGSVYLRVPAAMAGPGQVEVLVQGRLQVVQAFTRSPHPLPNQSRIKVVGVIDQSTLLVEPLDGASAGATPPEV